MVSRATQGLLLVIISVLDRGFAGVFHCLLACVALISGSISFIVCFRFCLQFGAKFRVWLPLFVIHWDC